MIAPRNFRPLAEAMNRAAWARQNVAPAPAVSTALLDKIEDSAHRQQARYLAERRARIVAAIAECSEHPALFWNHRYFSRLRGSVVASTDDAVVEVASDLAFERRRLNHWSRKPERVASLGEALVFARYFRRYSRAVWARRAA